MTPEEKELLLKDLCARLPYGAKTSNGHGILKLSPRTDVVYIVDNGHIPYLRPMSNMTEEEVKEFTGFASISQHRFFIGDSYFWYNTYEEEDWLNAHHFDYRDLIEKGLALKAPEEMYEV